MLRGTEQGMELCDSEGGISRAKGLGSHGVHSKVPGATPYLGKGSLDPFTLWESFLRALRYIRLDFHQKWRGESGSRRTSP